LTTAIPLPMTISDRYLSSRTRVAVAVVGFALVTAAAAQISFHLPWTPVPITGQTFAVLLSGASLGARRGAASQALYVALGAIGLPFYADGSGGWSAATGATAGYLVGFVAAAALVGVLAERKQDRAPITGIPAMLAGTAIIYTFGVWWLSIDLHVAATKALELGMTPFVIGDALKLVAAALVMPVAWRAVEHLSRD
jgi:biotin transport system substrate-specific component